MKNIPSTKVAQTVCIIRESIQNGEWGDFLPGERTLARDLMISRACLRQALENLTREGILAPVVPSKRRAIAMRPRKKSLKASKKVIFFTPEPAHKAVPAVLEQIAQLRYHLEKVGMAVELVTSPVFKQKQISGDTMSSLVKEYTNAQWILHQCPEHIQRWFDKEPVRAIVLGSLFQGVTLPSIDIDFQSASRHATGTLLRKGHRRMGYIGSRTPLAGGDLALVGMNEAMESHQGESIAPMVALNHNFHVARLTASLDRLYASSHPPTGLIVQSSHHFVTAFSHLMSKGIRIPEDVSIICLSHDHCLDRLSPPPVFYTTGDQLSSRLVRLILNPTTGPNSKSLMLVPNAMPGKSVGSAV